MESIAALSLASNIIQVIDFSSRLVSRGRELYKSADGSLAEHAVLSDAARNLFELQEELQLSDTSGSHKKLIKLQKESEDVVQELAKIMDKAKRKNGNRKWQSIYQALRSVKTDREISNIARRLDKIRKQVDTALLVSIRSFISTSSKAPAAGPGAKDGSGSDEDTQHRLTELLSAIHDNSWRPSVPGDREAFSVQMKSFTAAELQARFRKTIMSRLYFRQMPNRVEHIRSAHSETFEWIFQQKKVTGVDFSEWLQSGDSSIYWITGKPGSGKSTLTKFLYQHPRLQDLLDQWAGSGNVLSAGFHFWNSGNRIQMSRLGLLRTLLHALFTQDNGLMMQVMTERWDEFVTFGGGQEAFEEPELHQILDRVLSQPSRQFFLLIDGLDEFEGEPNEIINFVLGASRPNVKLCVASRPWLPFEDAFSQRPSLRLEDLTRQDIANYVSSHLLGNDHFSRLQQIEPQGADTIVHEIVEKASGVFLWVHLVVQSLLEGLVNSDRLPDLRARLDVVPGDLEALFAKMLGNLHSNYFKQACELFRLLRTYYDISRLASADIAYEPTLLGLYCADDEDTKSSLQSKNDGLETSVALQQVETMRRRINARCKGFLEVYTADVVSSYGDRKVGYLHRTARDFIESDAYWPIIMEHTGDTSFKPEERWANAILWLQKAYPLHGISSSDHLTRMCLKSAIVAQERTGVVQKTYLDEFCNAQYKHSLKEVTPQIKGGLLFFKLSTVSKEDELVGYVALTLQMAQPKIRKFAIRHWEIQAALEPGDLRNILLYYRAHRALRWMRQRPAIPQYE